MTEYRSWNVFFIQLGVPLFLTWEHFLFKDKQQKSVKVVPSEVQSWNLILDGFFNDSDDDENMYVDSDIPQRRSAVLAPVRVHIDNNMRVSLAINGTRNSVNAILNAQMAARNVARKGNITV